MMQTILEQATDRAYALLQTVGGDVWTLPEPMKTLIVVDTSQGIVDNGGLEYFFESDFPHNPPYPLFVEAFRRIGAVSVASCIEAASQMFPFSQPHLYVVKRQQWIESIKDDETHEFVRLSRSACGDGSVFQKLSEYARRNWDEFGTA